MFIDRTLFSLFYWMMFGLNLMKTAYLNIRNDMTWYLQQGPRRPGYKMKVVVVFMLFCLVQSNFNYFF